MGLPNNPKMKMIPNAWKPIFALYNEHDAWYSGSIDRLHSFYVGQKNYHWAVSPYENRRTAIHVPIAGDLATASADLLFSVAPKYEIPEAQDVNNTKAIATDDRLTEIIEKGDVHGRLIEGGETCAALGGVYLKVNWDKNLIDVPLLSIAQADSAIPEFNYGILTAVTFWKVIERTDDDFYRLIERHEKGFILYGLYKGDKDYIGEQLPLNSRNETMAIYNNTNGTGVIDTKINDLLVRYVPNMKPNRMFRGSNIGQSDFSGAEAMMDALDETFSSWMRDIRLGQSRIIVPESYLEFKNGKAGFNVDKEIFTTIESNPMDGDNGITESQFDIRTKEHLETAKQLIERIVVSAGYAPQSFGLNVSGAGESGTALNIREKKTAITKAKKEKYWTTSLEDIFHLMLKVDNLHLGNNTSMDFRPNVQIADINETDMGLLSETIFKLNQSQAISIETKVRMVHPDWDETQINAEIKRIMDEAGMTLPDIMQDHMLGD